MYIGIREKIQFKNGTVEAPLIAFNDSYINSKVAYYQNGILDARIDLPACDDLEDFTKKVKYTSDLTVNDFGYLKCIPAETFSLYNDAENKLSSSISLLFEQCGGRYSNVIDPSSEGFLTGDEYQEQYNELVEQSFTSLTDIFSGGFDFSGGLDASTMFSTTSATAFPTSFDLSSFGLGGTTATGTGTSSALDINSLLGGSTSTTGTSSAFDVSSLTGGTTTTGTTTAGTSTSTGSIPSGTSTTTGSVATGTTTTGSIPSSTSLPDTSSGSGSGTAVPDDTAAAAAAAGVDLSAFGFGRRLQNTPLSGSGLPAPGDGPLADVPPSDDISSEYEESICMNEKEMREYMANKVIVIYVAESYVAQED